MKIRNHRKIRLLFKLFVIMILIYTISRNSLLKAIPIQFDIITFCLLSAISSYFLIKIYQLLFEKEIKITILLKHFLLNPLILLDKTIKESLLFHNIYTNIIFSSCYKLDYFIIKTNLFFYMIPNFVLIFTLFLDIFHFNYFCYFYHFLLFTILLFFYRYFLFSLVYAKHFYVKEIYSYTIVSLTFEDVNYIYPYTWTFENQQEGIDEDLILDYGSTGCVHFDDFLDYYIELKYKTGKGTRDLNLFGDESFSIHAQVGRIKEICTGRPKKYDDEYQDYPCKYLYKETKKIAEGLLHLGLILKYLKEIENNKIIKKQY